MNGRNAYRLALDMEMKQRAKEGKRDKNDTLLTKKTEDHRYDHNEKDDIIAEAIDEKEIILKNVQLLERLSRTGDVQGFLQDAAPKVAAKLLITALGEKSKLSLEAQKDILDRAGYGKVTKHAVAKFDATSSKEAIISSILGSKKDLNKVGIEITDDDEDIEEGS